MKEDKWYYKETLECGCHQNDHTIFMDMLKYEKEDPPMVFIQMFVNDYPSIFRRIGEAIKYVLRIGKYRLQSTIEHVIDINEGEKEADEMIAFMIKYKEEMRKFRIDNKAFRTNEAQK